MNFIENQIFHRITTIIELPTELGYAVKCLGEVVSGVAGTILATIFLGCSEKLNRHIEKLESSSRIFPELLDTGLQILNPDAVHVNELSDGCLSMPLNHRFFNWYSTLDNASFFNRQIVSRAAIALYVPILTIIKAADFALGLIASVFAILTFGTIEKIHVFAHNQLRTLHFVTFPIALAYTLVKPNDYDSIKLFYKPNISKISFFPF